jgi:hypothetical protein
MNALAGLNAVTLIFVALCVFAIGYRFYGVFMADKVLKLDKERPMPPGVTVKSDETPSPGSPGMRVLTRYPITVNTLMRAVGVE